MLLQRWEILHRRFYNRWFYHHMRIHVWLRHSEPPYEIHAEDLLQPFFFIICIINVFWDLNPRFFRVEVLMNTWSNHWIKELPQFNKLLETAGEELLSSPITADFAALVAASNSSKNSCFSILISRSRLKNRVCKKRKWREWFVLLGYDLTWESI